MKRGIMALQLAAWVVALAGCVDFVDPVGLKFSRPTLLSVFVRVDDRASACGDQVARPEAAAPVGVCVQAELQPGRDKYGERFRVLDDTLRVMGVAVTPSMRPDSSLVYTFRTALPREQMSDTALTLVFPRMEAAAPTAALRWRLVEPIGADTLVRAPGEGVRVALRLPDGVVTPQPGFRYWNVAVNGSSASAGYNGFGIPRAAYDFPAEVLAGLGGERFRASLAWRQNYQGAAASGALEIAVFLEEHLSWMVETRAP